MRLALRPIWLRYKTLEIIFPLKASLGRGKLSPQVTDEGADKQQFAVKLPLIRLLTAFAATFPKGTAFRGSEKLCGTSIRRPLEERLPPAGGRCHRR